MLLPDPERRERAGAAGYARVRDHFSAAQMIDKISLLCDELLNKDKP